MTTTHQADKALAELAATRQQHWHGRPIDMDKGMLTAARRKLIVEQVNEALLVEGELSSAKLAHIVGVSRSTVSRILAGTYTGDTDQYLKRLARWLDERRTRLDVPDADYVPTSIGERIQTVCDLAIEQPCVGIVKTPSGAGKTVSLRAAARRVGSSRCIYLSAGEAMTSKKELLLEICEAMGITAPARAGRYKLHSLVRNRLAGMYSGGKGFSFLIIVDEATTLLPSAINMLRNLHDEPACRAAVVLADTIARLDTFLYSRSGIAGGNEQLRSRSKAQFVWPPDREITAADVKLVTDGCLAALGHRGQLRPPAYAYLHGLAQRPGCLRNVVARLQNLHYVATRRKWQAEFTPGQLDWVAELSGEQSQITHGAEPPFKKVAVA